MDNESSFISPIVLNFIDRLGVKVYTTPAQKSEINGTIERVHSTIIEIFRCLQAEYPELSGKELTNIATDRYNNTVHSVTKRKPADVFFGRTSRINYQNLVDFRNIVNEDLKNEIARNQKLQLARENKKRSKAPQFQSGEVVYKRDKQIKSKDKPLYKPEIVSENSEVTVTTQSGKKIHKSHIKNI